MGWLKCDRCGGRKPANYTPLCEECKFEDAAKKMFDELDKWRETGTVPPVQGAAMTAQLPRPTRDEPIRQPHPLDTQEISGD